MDKITKLFLLCVFCLSCKQKEVKEHTSNIYTVIDTLKFEMGFIPHSRCSGSYFDNKHQKTLIYFSEPTNDKLLKIFDDKANELYHINLDKGLEYLDYDIYNINIISTDTILLSAAYNNRTAFINAKGEVWKTMDLSPMLQKEGYKYIVHPSANSGGMISSVNSLLFNLEWRGYVHTDTIPIMNEYERLVDWYNNVFNAFYFFEVSDVYDDSITGAFRLKGIYKNLYNIPFSFTEPNFYRVINNKIFFFTTYSDNFLIFDVNTFELIKKVKLSSDYTRIGIEPIPLDTESLGNLQEITNQKARKVGYTEDILYDDKAKNYYIMQHYENKNRFRSHQFSIIILDENFEKTNEIPFTDNKIKNWVPIKTDRGLMFCSNSNTDNSDEPKIFYIVDF